MEPITSERMLRVMLMVALAIAACLPLRAEILPTFSIRYLAIEADTIVVGAAGAAGNGTLPSTWKITEVLKGKETLLGQVIALEYASLDPVFPSPLFAHKFPGKPVPRITKALLFLSLPKVTEDKEVHPILLSLGSGPSEFFPSFCSREGRSFLLAKIAEGSLPALRELGSGSNMWYPHRAQLPHTNVMTREE